ncbi:MAG: family 10 glycosylhydrolase, partial [Clostridia bacterium]|nr:family 10 glycosylhydrolase [Clostridia bacterium]
MKRFQRIISLLLTFAFLFSVVSVAPLTADAASATIKIAYFSLDDYTSSQVNSSIQSWFNENTVVADNTTISSVSFTKLTASQIQSGSLSSYDLLLIGAGGGGAITSSLGSSGGSAIESYVASGGGYVGIGGGTYAAVLGYSTTTKYLELINYESDYPVQYHGQGQMVVRPSSTNNIITEDMLTSYYVAYAQNPAVLTLGNSTDSRMGTPINAIKFVSNARNNLTASQNSSNSNYTNMTGTPAVACATFGSGHVAVTGLQVQSDNQPANMDYLLGRMVLYAAGYTTAKATPKSINKLSTEIVAEWVNIDNLYYEGSAGTTAYIRHAANAGITDMYVLVKGTGGSVAYTGSSYALSTSNYGSRDILNEVITQAHSYGIRVHAWISALNDSTYSTKYPNERLYHYHDGYSGTMINPRSSSYLTYMKNLVKEMLTKYDFDGLHLDYIRYSHIACGWSSSDQAQMKEYGIDIDELKKYVDGTYYVSSVDDGYIFRAHGNGNNSVVQFANMRCDNIKNFASGLISAAKSAKSDVILSAAYFLYGAYQGNHYVSGANSLPTTSSSFGDLMYGQSYVHSASLYDYVCPMLYASSGGTSYDGSDQWVAALSSSAIDKGNKVVAALQAYTPASADSLSNEIIAIQQLAAEKEGMLGFGLFKEGTYGYGVSTYSSSENMLKVNVSNGFSALSFGKVVIKMQDTLSATSVYSKSGLSNATISISSDKKTVTITKSTLLAPDAEFTIYLNTTGTLNKTLGPAVVYVYDTDGGMTRCYNTYKEGTAMPGSVTYTPVPTSSSALGSFSVSTIAEGMNRVVNYYNANGALPNYNTLNGIQVKIPAYMRLAATALINIAAGSPSQTVSYLTSIASSSTSTTTFDSNTISKAGYLYLASKMLAYMSANSNTAPNYITYPGTSDLDYSGQISYARATIILARAMAFYHSYGVLPDFVCAAATETSATKPTAPASTPTPSATATVAPTATPTPTVKPTAQPTPKASYSVTEVATMLYDAYVYHLENGTLPDTVYSSGAPISLPTYIRMGSAALTNINAGTLTASIPYVECFYPTDYTNAFTSASISKAGYLYIAQKTVAYCDENDNEAPRCITFPGSSGTTYSGTINFAKSALVIARALAAYKMNGVLPASVSTADDAAAIIPASLTVNQVIDAVSAASDYHVANGTLPSSITLCGGNASMPSYFRAGALAIIAISNNNPNATISYVDATTPNGYTSSFNSTTINKAGYLYAMSRLTAYMTSTNSYTPANYVSFPGSSGTTYSGYLPYQLIVLITARACAYYKAYGVLPDYISTSTSATVTTPTPASTVPPTVAPTTAAPTATPTVKPTSTPTAAPTTQAPTEDAALPTAHPKLSTSLTSGT